jgi:hypothetical protein
MVDEKAVSIASAVADEIEKLRSGGFIMAGAGTDNASNQKLALNPTGANRLQQTSKTCVIRIPAGLELRDILQNCCAVP